MLRGLALGYLPVPSVRHPMGSADQAKNEKAIAPGTARIVVDQNRQKYEFRTVNNSLRGTGARDSTVEQAYLPVQTEQASTLAYDTIRRGAALRHNPTHHPTVDIGQAEIAARVSVGQSFVV